MQIKLSTETWLIFKEYKIGVSFSNKVIVEGLSEVRKLWYLIPIGTLCLHSLFYTLYEIS